MISGQIRNSLNRRNFLKVSSETFFSLRLLMATGLGMSAGRAQAQLKTPAIFYSPHQDDEAIGMAGAIAEHKDAGRPVFLVLLTNGINDGLLATVNQKLESVGRPKITMEQMMWGRRTEFIASGQAMGVDKLFIVDLAQGFEDTLPYGDANSYALFKQKIVDVVRSFEEKYPGSSHKLSSNDPCTVCLPATPNPTHQACFEAGMLLRSQGILDIYFYRIYEYWKPISQRTGGYILNLSSSWMNRKRKALDQYKLWDPDASRYSLGYLSVPTLIDAAYDDPREFIDL